MSGRERGELLRVTRDASGTVTATPRGQYPGAWAQNYVTITYPDHTVDYALFTVRVVAPSVSLAESLDLSWGDATVAPGGSVRDDEVVAAATAAGVTMYFTGTRHFAH